MKKSPSNNVVPPTATTISMPISLASAGLAQQIASELGGELSIVDLHLNITTGKPVELANGTRTHLEGLLEEGFNIKFQ